MFPTIAGICLLVCSIVIFIIRLQIIYTKTKTSTGKGAVFSLDGLVLFPCYLVLGVYILNKGLHFHVVQLWVFVEIFATALVLSYSMSKLMVKHAIKKRDILTSDKQNLQEPINIARKSDVLDTGKMDQISVKMENENPEVTHKEISDIDVVKDILREWDPLKIIGGLAESGFRAVEYDKYAAHILEMLQNGKSRKEIYDHLSFIQTDTFKARVTTLWNNKIVEKLVEWWQNK